MLLTISTALIAGKVMGVYFILLIAALKFLLVAFQFMELKKAHVFWKTTLVIVLVIITGIVLILVPK